MKRLVSGTTPHAVKSAGSIDSSENTKETKIIRTSQIRRQSDCFHPLHTCSFNQEPHRCTNSSPVWGEARVSKRRTRVGL
eukprot:superscaffoldBa00007531_g22623